MAFNARGNGNGNGKGNTNAKGNGNWNNKGNGNGNGNAPANSNGNGNGNENVTFYLPILNHRNDCYCARCATPVKSFWPNCPATTCGAALAKDDEVAILPKGWKYCGQCKVIARKTGTNFCRFCAHPGQGGRHFLAKVKTMARMKLQLEEALSKQTMECSDDDEEEDPMGQLDEDDMKAADMLMAEIEGKLPS